MRWFSVFRYDTWLFTILLTSGLQSSTAAPADEMRPNFVFVLIDDLGWSDVGCFGSTFHQTPNPDQKK